MTTTTIGKMEMVVPMFLDLYRPTLKGLPRQWTQLLVEVRPGDAGVVADHELVTGLDLLAPGRCVQGHLVEAKEVGLETGGLIAAGTAANNDSAGTGIPGAFRISRKIAYPVEAVIEWLIDRLEDEKMERSITSSARSHRSSQLGLFYSSTSNSLPTRTTAPAAGKVQEVRNDEIA